MSSDFKLSATARNDMGKGASRRLRRLANQVPAIVYGGTKKPQNISLAHNMLQHALENEAFYSSIITLSVDGNSEAVILKDIQRHPAKPAFLHIDFLRISKTQKLNIKVPLHFINEDICVGVKLGGGSISRTITDLEISCLPEDLPEFIEVDVAAMDVGDILHISDVTLPSGVESVDLSYGEEHDQPVFIVNMPKVDTSDDDTEDSATEDKAEDKAEDGDK